MSVARYVGFTLDQDLDDEIEALRQPLIGGTLRKPLTLHVTLITPPMMRRVDHDDIKHRLLPLVKKTNSFNVILTGPHSFAGRTLYIGVSSQELKEFQQDVMRELGISGFMIEKVGKAIYTPHITLIQNSGPLKIPESIEEVIMSHQFPKRTVLKDLHVFENTGPRQYKKLESFRLI